MDITMLWSSLVSLAFDASRNEVKTTLQDLNDRGYVRYKQVSDRDTGEVQMMQIELTARGRDLLEGTIEDPAVGLL